MQFVKYLYIHMFCEHNDKNTQVMCYSNVSFGSQFTIQNYSQTDKQVQDTNPYGYLIISLKMIKFINQYYLFWAQVERLFISI